MKLNQKQTLVIERVVHAFETGKAAGRHGLVSVHADGPHGMRQISYGRAQVTEYGKLRLLIARYAGGSGMFSDQLARYVDDIGASPLADDRRFLSLLREAGTTDPVMRLLQDEFFHQQYFVPAFKWADENEFQLPLSALVVYDSFVHSGSMLWAIRSRFTEVPPAGGGDEKTWITEYVRARERFLATHERKIVRRTVYRTRVLMHEVENGNWNLKQLPIRANGVQVSA